MTSDPCAHWIEIVIERNKEIQRLQKLLIRESYKHNQQEYERQIADLQKRLEACKEVIIRLLHHFKAPSHLLTAAEEQDRDFAKEVLR